jgi:hypothetical protein
MRKGLWRLSLCHARFARFYWGWIMKFSTVLLLSSTCLLVSSAAALAKHGKVGLWNVTSTIETAMPPEMMAQMKKSGASMPPSKPVVIQMCMSQEEVNSDNPPHVDRASTGCSTRIVSQTPLALKAAMTCKGAMKGTGSIEVAYTGAEHYAGAYSFKGTLAGNPTNVTTKFSGDWVKADCGKIPPYKLRTQ